MGRFLVNLPLRMVGTDVAVVAGFGLAGLFQAEFMAQVAFLALTDGFVGGGLADVVAAFTCEASDCRAFHTQPMRFRILSGEKLPSGNGLVGCD